MFNMARTSAISPFVLLLSSFSEHGVYFPSAEEAAAAAAATTTTTTQRVITKDVVIIGGGASGAHAALRLKDMGQSIVLVEKEVILVRSLTPSKA